MSVSYSLIEAKSILRPHGLAPYFITRYGLNLYRGCEHGCVYCEGRAERYYVEGNFEREIAIKTNAAEVLDRELARAREPGFVFFAGGVCDAWQPAEAQYGLARATLHLLQKYGFSVLALTKSALVERDLDVLARINQSRRAILAFSICTTDEELREQFEPGAAPIAERFRILALAKERGLPTGIMAMPLLPGLSDQEAHLRPLLQRAKEVGVSFVSFSGLTLRPGVQRQAYLEALAKRQPNFISAYGKLYGPKYGSADKRYLQRLYQRCCGLLSEYDLPKNIPIDVFAGLLPLYDEVALRLVYQADEGEADDVAELFAAILQWAAMRLKPLRGPLAYKEVEASFVWALKTGALAQELEIPEPWLAKLEELTSLVVRQQRYFF